MSKNVQSAQRDQTQNGQQEQILTVKNLRKTFGGITAVADVSFHVEKGSITGLIGPNGAGKSTTFDLITGVQRPDGGAVEFNDTEITGYRSDQVANQGLVRTFQIARELSEMTVLENLMLAPQNQVGEAIWRAVLPRARTQVVEQEKALRKQAWEMLELFEIEHVAHESAGNLSGGQRKLLEMARVLMTDPEMVLLDEPLAGVNPTLEEKLIDRLHTLKEQGYTFLFVEHDMDVIMNNCDTVIVMHQGSVLTEGQPDTVKNNDKVLDAYLGEEVTI
ncbi:amino acid/amide ABC transporter ATP-binding protein 1, HAAT family [Haloarcula vallismortis]|uniref:Probable branched-chain amino acid transport ATP-binding protein LivG n=2 Tax=Haloarcula vallismortis TaxID=28442 RepID=M0JBL8_HALVA|nr:ABC transporter ATP-binding protein [Haloarcula vallismortis]EMA05065.1 branched-chain amino acid ABC transporter ATP-binding protein [Haloarcula vallismortis ATCC 29715]SDX12720.1 amino acid/amide ABC transporter ATP-binding protein 1, HAAT family [Haloarcula vallismortis]